MPFLLVFFVFHSNKFNAVEEQEKLKFCETLLLERKELKLLYNETFPIKPIIILLLSQSQQSENSYIFNLATWKKLTTPHSKALVVRPRGDVANVPGPDQKQLSTIVRSHGRYVGALQPPQSTRRAAVSMMPRFYVIPSDSNQPLSPTTSRLTPVPFENIEPVQVDLTLLNSVQRGHTKHALTRHGRVLVSVENGVVKKNDSWCIFDVGLETNNTATDEQVRNFLRQARNFQYSPGVETYSGARHRNLQTGRVDESEIIQISFQRRYTTESGRVLRNVVLGVNQHGAIRWLTQMGGQGLELLRHSGLLS